MQIRTFNYSTTFEHNPKEFVKGTMGHQQIQKPFIRKVGADMVLLKEKLAII